MNHPVSNTNARVLHDKPSRKKGKRKRKEKGPIGDEFSVLKTNDMRERVKGALSRKDKCKLQQHWELSARV